jgi:hypothetical protein
LAKQLKPELKKRKLEKPELKLKLTLKLLDKHKLKQLALFMKQLVLLVKQLVLLRLKLKLSLPLVHMS